MKKTIIALTAASSMVLASGAAIAEGEDTDATKPGSSISSSELVGNNGSSEGDDDEKTNLSDELSLSSDFFGWEEDEKGTKKIKDIAAAIAGVVGILGSFVTLFNTIEKIGKQFQK